MAQSAILQMLRDVNWDGLDILVIDMPPGTGDIHLTIAQRVKLSGGVVVSTPQDIALIDARKGLEMFQKVAVPILGIVENMSYYSCPKCGNHDDIFGHGGARDEATKIGVPFLGEIPLHSLIRKTSDAGTPVTLSETESDQARAFIRIAENVISGLQVTQKPAPTIRMEE
jgi:ATP-binding protein involved in chromosome partitioning